MQFFALDLRLDRIFHHPVLLNQWLAFKRITDHNRFEVTAVAGDLAIVAVGTLARSRPDVPLDDRLAGDPLPEGGVELNLAAVVLRKCVAPCLRIGIGQSVINSPYRSPALD